MDKVELLSPAGDLERLKVTLLYGADAVYIGGQNYSLRANANNFSLEEIKEGCSFAHKLGKRVHLTLNIVFHNEDMDGVEDYIRKVVDCGIDAFIVSDPFLISYIKKNYPNVEVHLSTQNSTSNYKAIEYFEEEGVDRVVLARELSKKEIKEIVDKVHCDIEVFIHGAMCTCFSGRCALSNYVTNRDANRGGCAQVCRFSFSNPSHPDFTMALKDLNMAIYIKDLIEIGVSSFKVEGRMRSIYYIATVIKTYRQIIDKIMNNSLTLEYSKYYLDILNRCANRDSTPQFFDKEPGVNEQYYLGREEVSNQDFLGLVLDYDEENQIATIEERNYFEVGTTVEFFGPKLDATTFKIEKIIDENEEEVTAARHPKEVLKIKCPIKLEKNDMMRLKIFDIKDYL